MGRNLEYDRSYGDHQASAVVDDRGFADLMRYLFPDLKDEREQAVPWHSPEHPHHARLAWSSADSSRRQRPVRAEVWEPVVRHVALALTALETTSQAPSDAYTHLRVEAETAASGYGRWASCSARASPSAPTTCRAIPSPDPPSAAVAPQRVDRD